jgi:cytochrome c oxidase subunit 4
VVVYVTLLILTIITVAVSRIDLGALNMFVAMFVASVKAAIVALWFMHLKYENKLNRVVFASGFFFLLVMFAFSAIDIFSRGNFLNIYGK